MDTPEIDILNIFDEVLDAESIEDLHLQNDDA